MNRTLIFIFSGIVIYSLLFLSESTVAQSKNHKSEKAAIKKEAGPPPWAPAHGYRAKTRYTYFSEHNFYYDNSRGVYIHLRGKNWEISANIPDAFKNVNLSTAVKVDLNYDADNPQKYNKDHKSKYGKG